MSEEAGKSVLDYAASQAAQEQRRSAKWWIMTVAGWFLALPGGLGIAAFIAVGTWVTVTLARDKWAGQTVIVDPEIYKSVSLAVAKCIVTFLAGVWLLFRRRKLQR